MSKLVTNASDILGIKDLREERVFVKEWDRDVIVREFSGRELHTVLGLDSFRSMKDGDGGEFAMLDAAKVCVIAVKDEEGKRIFTDEQAEELADKSLSAVMTLFNAALKVSGLTGDEQDKEKNA